MFKLLAKPFALLALLLGAQAALAQVDITFTSSGGYQSVETCTTKMMPWGPPVYGCSTQPGNFMITPSTNRPAGTTTQWISFKIYSDGYFGSLNNGDHFAMALKGQWLDTSQGPGGRGVILGTVVDHPEGCNEGQHTSYHAFSQIESYWAWGNHV